jgi:hypothetical protein
MTARAGASGGAGQHLLLAERALHLALRLCAIRPTAWAGNDNDNAPPDLQIEELAIIGTALIIGSLSTAILCGRQGLCWYPGQRLEGGNGAAQESFARPGGRHANPHHPTMAEHQ